MSLCFLTVSKCRSYYSTFIPFIFPDDGKRTHYHIWKLMLSSSFILPSSTLKTFSFPSIGLLVGDKMMRNECVSSFHSSAFLSVLFFFN